MKDLHTPPAAAICHPLAGTGSDISGGPKKNYVVGSGQDLSKTSGSPCSLETSRKERDDDYHNVVVQLATRWRVIVCKDFLQWIIQKRTAEPLHPGVWRGRSYVTARSSLIRLCASRDLISDDTALAKLEALPAQFSGLYKK